MYQGFLGSEPMIRVLDDQLLQEDVPLVADPADDDEVARVAVAELEELALGHARPERECVPGEDGGRLVSVVVGERVERCHEVIQNTADGPDIDFRGRRPVLAELLGCAPGWGTVGEVWGVVVGIGERNFARPKSARRMEKGETEAMRIFCLMEYRVSDCSRKCGYRKWAWAYLRFDVPVDDRILVKNENSQQELHANIFRIILGEGTIPRHILCEVTPAMVVHGNEYSVVVCPPALDPNEKGGVLVGENTND